MMIGKKYDIRPKKWLQNGDVLQNASRDFNTGNWTTEWCSAVLLERNMTTNLVYVISFRNMSGPPCRHYWPHHIVWFHCLVAMCLLMEQWFVTSDLSVDRGTCPTSLSPGGPSLVASVSRLSLDLSSTRRGGAFPIFWPPRRQMYLCFCCFLVPRVCFFLFC